MAADPFEVIANHVGCTPDDVANMGRDDLANAKPADHVLLFVDELLAELSNPKAPNTTSCQDCRGGLGVCVEPNGDWEIVQLHSIPCVNGPRQA